MRPSQPLLASISTDFSNLNGEMQRGFRPIGAALREKCHKGTIFGPSIKLRRESDEGGNIDIVHEAADQISIIRPILTVDILHTVMKEVPNHCKTPLPDAISAFYPRDRQEIHHPPNKSAQSRVSHMPTWLQKFADPKKGDTPTEETTLLHEPSPEIDAVES